MALRILMVDDSLEDQAFVRYALEKSGVGEGFIAVNDGLEAIQYLKGEGQFTDRDKFPVPNMVFCDLKMPRMDGFQFLEWVKDHADCSVIPTIILSSSGIARDVRRAYELGANAYIVKPTALDALVEVIKTTCDFWDLCQRPVLPQRCG